MKNGQLEFLGGPHEQDEASNRLAESLELIIEDPGPIDLHFYHLASEDAARLLVSELAAELSASLEIDGPFVVKLHQAQPSDWSAVVKAPIPLDAITGIGPVLRDLAEKYEAVYDGWDVEVEGGGVLM